MSFMGLFNVSFLSPVNKTTFKCNNPVLRSTYFSDNILTAGPITQFFYTLVLLLYLSKDVRVLPLTLINKH